MVRLMDSIDVHNTIDTMTYSSFVYDYMYDDDFCDVCDEAHISKELNVPADDKDDDMEKSV